MEKKIKQVQDYFIAKILAGEFRITEISEHRLKLIVDEKYPFEIWIANGPTYRRLYEYSNIQFMTLVFTEEQSIRCDSVLQPAIQEWRKEVLLVEKKKQLEQLKKELGEE